MPRVLLLSTTTGYQTRTFGEAAERLGIELVFATDRCHVLDDPWRDAAVPVRFHAEEESLRAIVEAAAAASIDGIIALGDRPTVLAALAARALGLRGHPPEAARASSNKVVSRTRLAAAALPSPWFRSVPVETEAEAILSEITFPCVVKPAALSGSRGVIRASDPGELRAAFDRLRRLLFQPDVLAMRDPANETIIVEQFIDGQEFALEGIVEAGKLHVLALFDKPVPLDGPFFEETIYVTPSAMASVDQDHITWAIAEAVAALGLSHGPVHAECRVNDRGVFVLEVAARPIGGLCARALRFTGPDTRLLPLEEILLRHALGESVSGYVRERRASAVMMIPIPRDGLYRRVDGLGDARAVPGIEEVIITAKPDQRILALPEGSSYLGFIFARAQAPDDAVAAVRAAHARLRFVIEAGIRVT